MNSRILMIFGAAVLIPSISLAQNQPASAPEQAPAQTEERQQQQTTPDPYTDFNKRVQERLKALGFYAGPVNGDIGPNSQAALAQFQLSVPLPASGALDDQTVAALGLERSMQASSGESSSNTDQQGGSVEAGTKTNASAGASSPAEVKGN
jgi:peptidoglycan hydrolase-like protein with peptidoglycan-binding domain